MRVAKASQTVFHRRHRALNWPIGAKGLARYTQARRSVWRYNEEDILR